MGSATQAIELSPVPPDQDAALDAVVADLCDLAARYPGLETRPEEIKDDIRGGRAVAFVISTGGFRAGSFVLAHVPAIGGNILEITAARANLPGVDLTATVLPLILEFARGRGYAKVDCETERRGLANKLLAAGFTICETEGAAYRLERVL